MTNPNLNVKKFTPYLVADRQASLRIISGIKIPENKHIGLMTHVNTHKNFKEAFKVFPCVNPQRCSIIEDNPCPYKIDINQCRAGLEFQRKIFTICDSAVFTKEGYSNLDYTYLFQEYEKLKIDFGVIIDIIKDRTQTLISATKAIEEYQDNSYSFKLLGVAQGKSVNEYIDCVSELIELGYSYIGIGGMLVKRVNSVRYVNVRNEDNLRLILSEIRDNYPNINLFALGCYSPKRHILFRRYSVFGSDYKGWIFQYQGSSPKRGNVPAQKKRYYQIRDYINANILSRNQYWNPNNKMIIISCSKTKHPSLKKAQAIKIYDGIMFKILRKHLWSFSNRDGFDIFIISSKYGLIEPTKVISPYDEKLSLENVETFIDQIRGQFHKILQNKDYSDVFINVGSTYLKAIHPILSTLPNDINIEIAKGKIGQKQQLLKQWIVNNY